MLESQTLEDRQRALEEESVFLGVARYNKSRERLDESTTAPGRTMLRRIAGPLELAIIAFLAAARNGQPGRRHAAALWLQDLDPAELAVLTATCVVNAVSASRVVRAQALSTIIAKSIEDSVRYEKFREESPALYETMQRRLSKSQAKGRSANKTMRKVAESAGVPAGEFEFPVEARPLIGLKLLELLIEASGVVELYCDTSRGPGRKQMVVRGTDKLLDWLEEAHRKNAAFMPVRLPMLVPPHAWSTPHDGGYLTNAGGALELVRTRNADYRRALRDADMPLVYAAVNRVQETPWKINAAVLDAMVRAWEAGGGIGKLPERDLKPLPARPDELARNADAFKAGHPDEFKAWKVSRAMVYEENAHSVSKRAAAAQKIGLARRFADEAAIYFPHTLDFRGRMYPVPALLHPQGDDVARGLLTFANGKPLGEDGVRWLAIHIAGLFGVDKVSFAARVQWVQDHSTELLDSALQPLDGDRFWTTADKPWQALAACYEWLGCTLEGEQYVSHLPIALDGSCNGLQNFSAMLRDSVGGAATNLIPHDKPADIYAEVAKLAEARVRKDAEAGKPEAIALDGKLTRAWAKKPVMTTPYGITRPGMRAQVLEQMAEEGMERDWAAAEYLAGVFSRCIAEVVIASAAAMTWLREAAKAASKADVAVHWTAPSGFLVQQDYRKVEGRSVDTHVAGRRVQIMLAVSGSHLDGRRQAQGISPNFVHSCDAAHLARTVVLAHANGVQDFAMIHDSYGTLAADTGTLAAALRHAFVEMYQGDVLGDFREELCAQLPPDIAAEVPPLPPFGDLDINGVLDSKYFFA